MDYFEFTKKRLQIEREFEKKIKDAEKRDDLTEIKRNALISQLTSDLRKSKTKFYGKMHVQGKVSDVRRDRFQPYSFYLSLSNKDKTDVVTLVFSDTHGNYLKLHKLDVGDDFYWKNLGRYNGDYVPFEQGVISIAEPTWLILWPYVVIIFAIVLFVVLMNFLN